jgi:hypothetical protein
MAATASTLNRDNVRRHDIGGTGCGRNSRTAGSTLLIPLDPAFAAIDHVVMAPCWAAMVAFDTGSRLSRTLSVAARRTLWR